MMIRMTTRGRLVTAIAMAALLVAGCNRGGDDNKKTIALVPKAMDSEFWLSMREGAQKAIEGRDDVVLSVLAPDREINVDQQVSILEDQIQRGAKALVVAPAGSAQVMPVLQNAIARGIQVVLVDSDAPLPGKSAYAGTDNRAGGTLAGQHVIEKVSTGKIAIITGVPGNQSQDERAAGFLETVRAVPGLEVVTSQPANSERSLGLTVMENILTAHPDIKAVFATNDQMALGAVEAIMARSPKAGIVVVGFDATAEAVQAIVEGRMSASVAQRPFEMGRRSVEAALALIDGRTVEPRIDTGTELVTSANAQGYKK
jgi:ribose transport system substrate-binding protein